MGPETTHEGIPTSESALTNKVESVRKQFLRRVLPVSIFPLLLLSLATIAAIFFLQRQTVDAVGSAESLLTESVLEAGVTRSSTEASRELASYVDQWIRSTNSAVQGSEFRSGAGRLASVVARENLDPNSPDFNERLQQITPSANALTSNLIEQLRTFEQPEKIQILVVTEDGLRVTSTNPDALNDYSQSEWFRGVKQSGSSFRSFVADGDGTPSFELAFPSAPSPGSIQGAILRVRVDMVNVQWLLDQIAVDEAVTVTLVDTNSAVLLADTATGHAETLLFDRSMMLDEASGFNSDLFIEGTSQNDQFISAAHEIAPRMGNEFDADFDWLVQTNQPVAIADAALADIREVSDDVSRFRWNFTIGVVAFLLLAALWAFMAARAAAARIADPIKRLSDQAKAAADEGIPSIVEAARTSDILPDLPQFEQSSSAEISVLASSLNTMQDAAVSLAAGQAKLRRQNVSRTFVSLGRRNQNLLNRQLEFISELEEQEQDADLLESLFRLDHLATRMRRNAENLLVLAGEQTPRRWGRPIAVRDVLRAAASEIADYPRVRLGEIDSATVSGGLATDLSHLIAELLENAGSFSPPNTPIEVLGQHTATHYRLAIVDQGIGLDPQALAQVNERLKNPVDFADAPSAYLGLFVVSRLAQEMGITVRLASADPTGEGRRRGTIAFIDLPVALLSSEAATPIAVGGSDGSAQRTVALDAAQQAAVSAPEPAPAPAAPAHPAVPAPAAQDLPTPTTAPVSGDQTAAGFPKRSRGATSIPLTPQVMTPSKPAVADVPAAAPAVSPVVAAAPAAASAPAHAQTVTPATAVTPAVPAPPATEITSAGFPKRGSSGPAVAAAPAPAAPSESAERIRRDPASVSASLQSIRSAVARGRASGQVTPAANPSRSAPTVPIAPVSQPTAAAQPAAAPTQPTPAPQPAAADPAEPTAVPQPEATVPQPLDPNSQPTHPTGSE